MGLLSFVVALVFISFMLVLTGFALVQRKKQSLTYGYAPAVAPYIYICRFAVFFPGYAPAYAPYIYIYMRKTHVLGLGVCARISAVYIYVYIYIYIYIYAISSLLRHTKPDSSHNVN